MIDMVKGSVVINEVIFPVVDIDLRQGGFVLYAERKGPTPAIDSGTSYTVHDNRGLVVYRGSLGEQWIPATGPSETIEVLVRCYAVGKEAVTKKVEPSA